MRIIRIGRAPGNDYVINYQSISTNHAEIRILDDGRMVFVDHSTNGTFVGQQFVHNAYCNILGNELLRFPGNITVRVADIVPKNGTVFEQMQGYAPYNQPVGVYANPGGNAPYNQPATNNNPANNPSRGIPQPGMDFGQTLSYYFDHYTDFNGRARRQEYWYIVLWNLIFGLIPVVNILWVLATLIPGLALSVRRLHDIGKSGWLLLLSLIPIIGAIVLFVFSVTDSDPGTNQYGPSPKYGA